jgi:hypothetical protein
MPKLFGVGELAELVSKQLGRQVNPREISDAIYQSRIPRDRCPLVGRNRVIPADLLPELRRVLQQNGAKAGRRHTKRDGVSGRE